MTRILLLLTIATLSACATQAPVQNAAELRRTHGYVVAARPLVVEAQPLTVTLRSLPKGYQVQLEPAGAHTLARWVPAGTYEIAEMVGQEAGTYSPIQVTAGEAIDLGGLTWANVGAKQRVLLPLRHAELSERTAPFILQAKEHLTSGALEWNPPVAPKPQMIPTPPSGLGLIGDLIMLAVEKANQIPLRERLDKSRDIREFTSLYVSSAAPLIGESVADAQGNLYIGSNFGQLRRRDARGVWSSIDTGTIAPITAVHVKDQAILIGTLDGRLRTSADGGRTWTGIHRFDGDEPVLSIHGHAGRYFVMTTRMSEVSHGRSEVDRATVYEVRALPSFRLDQIRRYEFPKLETFGLPPMNGVVAGRYYFVNRITAVDRLDIASGTWRSIQLPHSVSHLRASSDGKVLTAFRASGAFSKLSVSSDDGATWVPLDTPPYPVLEVRMESLTSGHASRWDIGAFSSSLQIVTYDAQARTWRTAWTSPQAACARGVRSSGGTEEFCVSRGGSILRITPEGLVPEFLAN